MILPRMLRIRQQFATTSVGDVAATVMRELNQLNLAGQIQSGETVAIPVGSRGIANIAEIVKAMVDFCRACSAVPFVVPAMGSHGGGTADGQRAILEKYGVTESFIGAEIRSSMETVIVEQSPHGFPIHFDKHAFSADHVLVCGRVKPHTSFVGDVESGLHKMLLIGLGNQQGANLYHRAVQDFSWPEIAATSGPIVLEKCRVLAGLAILENANDETGMIAAVSPTDFFDREKELLIIAKEWLPRLPFPQIDLLIVDAIGKNISGTGMDTNVIGRKFHDHSATENDAVNCKRIFVRSLTAETNGNACGLGIAEFTNQRTIDSVDYEASRLNGITSGHPSAVAMPIAFSTDRDTIEAALQTVGLAGPQELRVVQITDTLRLGELLVSEAFAAESAARDDLEIVTGPEEMPFDAANNLLPL